jgi:putative flavoprotein involved in K+ transport
MQTTNTIIIGAGQAGLAVSRCLGELGRDHIVLERGRVAERWHSERWDSLRLLTPNWMTRLPGHRYRGVDPDGFMRAAEAATFLEQYASSFDAPVREHTTVLRVHHDGDRFVVTTDQGFFGSDHIVIATGWCDLPAVPAMAQHLAADVHQVLPTSYKRPSDLPDGGVLVVGASPTGAQLAEELRADGREVVLAVGSHTRAPRRYRGMDIFWWLDLIGSFDRTIDDHIGDVMAARSEPALQVVGRPDHRNLDLATLQSAGVQLAGRLRRVDGARVSFARDLTSTVAAADRQMAALLDRIDRAIEAFGLSREVLEPSPVRRVVTSGTPDELDLGAAGIRSVVWATGYRRRYDWLDLPIFDGHGEICQRRGVTGVPGAYVLGLRFQHHRNSNFIDGVGRDARHVAHLIAADPRPVRARPCGAHPSETRTT